MSSSGNRGRTVEKGMSMMVLGEDGRTIMFINGKTGFVGTGRCRKNRRWRWRQSRCRTVFKQSLALYILMIMSSETLALMHTSSSSVRSAFWFIEKVFYHLLQGVPDK